MGENCCRNQPAQACENGAIENGEKVTQNTTGTTIAENGEKVTQNTTGTTIAEHVIGKPLDPTQELIFPCELQVSLAATLI